MKIKLQFCIHKNRNEEAKSLIKEIGVEVNIKKSGTPLLIACLHNNEEIALFCLEQGAKVNVENASGFTPLILASERGNYTIVKSLLEKGANVNSKNKYEVTSIMAAISDSPEQLQLIELLLKNGANPFMNIERNKEHPGRIANNAYELAVYFNRTEIIDLIKK